MRKLVLAFVSAFVVLCACSKEDMTTYTFYTGDEMISQLSDAAQSHGYTRVECDIVIAEYYQGQPVGNNLIRNVQDGEKYKFHASSKAEYVTVRLDSYASGHENRKDSEITMYIGNVIYLEIGRNTDIVLNENTLCQTSEPK